METPCVRLKVKVLLVLEKETLLQTGDTPVVSAAKQNEREVEIDLAYAQYGTPLPVRRVLKGLQIHELSETSWSDTGAFFSVPGRVEVSSLHVSVQTMSRMLLTFPAHQLPEQSRLRWGLEDG